MEIVRVSVINKVIDDMWWNLSEEAENYLRDFEGVLMEAVNYNKVEI